MLDLEQIERFYPLPFRSLKRNMLREYLQYKILEIIFSTKYANRLSFMGGTAIRIVHNSTRFSEDLDFDNFGLNYHEFEDLSSMVLKKLSREGFPVEMRIVSKGAFHAYFNFTGLLYNVGLSPHREEKLVIRVDSEAQEMEYSPERFILNKFDVFTVINVVPLGMLLSQKIAAILYRKRPMGRDFYDVIFLLGLTEPALKYLKIKADIDSTDKLLKKLVERCRNLNFSLLARDIEPFLPLSEDSKKIFLFPEYIRNVWGSAEQ